MHDRKCAGKTAKRSCPNSYGSVSLVNLYGNVDGNLYMTAKKDLKKSVLCTDVKGQVPSYISDLIPIFDKMTAVGT